MGGKPSRQTPADRRLKANQQPAPAAKKAAAKPMVPMLKMPPMRGGKRGR